MAVFQHECFISRISCMLKSGSLHQDTAGSERYEAMSRIYYRNAGAAVVCFDLIDRESFQKAKFWVEELRKYEEVRPICCWSYHCSHWKNDKACSLVFKVGLCSTGLVLIIGSADSI